MACVSGAGDRFLFHGGKIGMNPLLEHDGVWFVYDGDCPICGMAAHALRIKQQLGELHLVNARAEPNHPLLNVIRDQQLDLDEGMVILYQGRFYHGKQALRFMSRHGAPKGLFNHFNRLLFWSERLSSLLYPWMRATRNTLLRFLHKQPIDNLNLQAQPIFQPIFGNQWGNLPIVIKKHYANRPYSDDKVIVDGIMNVECHWPMKLAAPFYRLMGSIPLVTEYGIRCTVHFDSFKNSKHFGFLRHFWFVQRRFYSFRSRMLAIGEDKVIEIMRFGFCWKTRYAWQDETVRLIHDGYGLYWFGHLIPLPITGILGRGDAEERAIDDDHFAMNVTIRHPIFGVMYSYSGRFKVIQCLS